MEFFVAVALIMLFFLVMDIFTLQGCDCRDTFLLWIAGILIFISGLRCDSVDYISYQLIYESVPDVTKFVESYGLLKNVHGEWGFLLFNSIVKFIFDDFNVVLLVMAIFSVYLLVKVSKKYSFLPILSMYLYYTSVLTVLYLDK